MVSIGRAIPIDLEASDEFFERRRFEVTLKLSWISGGSLALSLGEGVVMACCGRLSRECNACSQEEHEHQHQVAQPGNIECALHGQVGVLGLVCVELKVAMFDE
jgi:hypothetical protein